MFPIIVGLVQWGETLHDNHRTGVELVHRDCGAPLTATVTCAEGHEVPLPNAAARLKNESYAAAIRRREAAELPE